MILSIIVAVANNNVIGKDNKLIWHLPADLKYFKALTMGAPIIMGRKTYESIGKPLPGRTSIIITQNRDFKADGCIVVHSLESALAEAKGSAEAFIIGGEQIYRQAMAFADKIYVTRVHETFEGDSFFPETDPLTWQLIDRKDNIPDEKNMFHYSFLTFKRMEKVPKVN